MAADGPEGGGGGDVPASSAPAPAAPAPAVGGAVTWATSFRSAGSSFLPRSLERAEKQAARVADRWAPESREALRGPSLRTLSFVDHLLAPSRPHIELGAGHAAPRAASAPAASGEAGAAFGLHGVPFVGGGRERPTRRTFPSRVCTSKARRVAPVALRISAACFFTSSSNRS